MLDLYAGTRPTARGQEQENNKKFYNYKKQTPLKCFTAAGHRPDHIESFSGSKAQ
jgi:hypothetical protein